MNKIYVIKRMRNGYESFYHGKDFESQRHIFLKDAAKFYTNIDAAREDLRIIPSYNDCKILELDINAINEMQ